MKLGWYIAALRRYATFSGRASRAEFWSFLLGAAIVCILVAAVEASVMPRTSQRDVALVWFVALAHVVPAYAVTVRRLHDTDRTGWLALFNGVPFGSLIVLVLASLPGTPWPNRYGSAPDDDSGDASATDNDRTTRQRFTDPNADGFDFLAGGYPSQSPPAPDALPAPGASASTTISSAVSPSSKQAIASKPVPPRDLIGELERLARLKVDGMLSEGEFTQLKARLLDTAPPA